jgi:hypothetical protein
MHPISKKQTSNLRRHIFIFCSSLFVAAFIFISCYPGDPLSTGELDVVTTLFDSRANFATKLTYAMPDTVIHLADSTEDIVEIDRQYDDLILDETNKNLQQAGFTRVTNPQQADVFVLPAATVTLYAGYQPYYWYWSYWYPYPPGWGGWYPWYPSGGTVYTYRVGTIFINMVDPSQRDNAEKRVASIWIAALNGVVDSASSNAARISSGIEQAFKQSPYLSQGK